MRARKNENGKSRTCHCKEEDVNFLHSHLKLPISAQRKTEMGRVVPCLENVDEIWKFKFHRKTERELEA
jgi:hypothetical protein